MTEFFQSLENGLEKMASELVNAAPVATEIAAEAPTIATDADVGLDMAAAAANQIAASEGMKDPEISAAEILSLKSKVAELEQLVTQLPDFIEAMKNSNATAFEQALEAAVAKLPVAVDAEKLVAEFEADLPVDWKARVTALLAMAHQHFGV